MSGPNSLRLFAFAFAFAVCAFAGAGAGASSAIPTDARATGAEAAFPCRTVVRKVRGKRRRVRVCTKPKPRPAPAPPQPRNVVLALESARAAAATVGEEGGTITAEAAGGAKLTLTIPAGALDGQRQITVTPVSSLSGLGTTRLLAGAQLGPDGLVLAEPATLSLELPRAVAGAVGVAWSGQGENVHRYPFARSDGRVQLRLVHFSGAGVADRPSDLLPTIETALTVSYAREVRPTMRAAETNDALFTPAVDLAFRWLRSVELVGLQERFRTWWSETLESLQRIFANAVERASERCQNHDLEQLGRLAAIERMAQQMTIPLPDPPVLERIERCARFELELEGVSTMVVPDGSIEHEVRGRVPIRWAGQAAGGAGYHGDGLIGTTALRISAGFCSAHGADAPLIVDGLSFLPRGGSDPQEVVLLLRLTETPAWFTCFGHTAPLPGFAFPWFILHADENATGDGLFVIRGWQWVGGEIVARKQYDRGANAGEGRVTERTTLILRHTPAP